MKPYRKEMKGTRTILGFLLVFLSSAVFAQRVNRYNDQKQRDGSWVLYHDTSKKQVKQVGRFENGLERDTFKYYIPKIRHPMSERIYDKKGGCYAFFYDKDRQIIAEGYYDSNQKKEGKWCYYDKGSHLSAVDHYTHGAKDGAFFVFFDDAKIAEYQVYKDGKKEGPYERFGEKSQPLEQVFFVQNRRHGEAVFYNSNGQVLIKGYYNNGFKDKVWKYYKGEEVSRTEDYSPQGRKKRKEEKKKAPTKTTPEAQDTTDVEDFLKELDTSN